MSFSACTSPRHGYMVSLQPPVCTAFRLGLLISVPLRGTTSYSVEALQYTTQQPHSSTVSSYSASIMLWRLNSHTHQRCHPTEQASCWGASTATLINGVILQCKHHAGAPQQPHSSTMSSYRASIMLWRLNSHTHQRCHPIVQASC